MSHRRQKIRDAVVFLVTGLPSGASVTNSRVYPESTETLPTIDVATTTESVDSVDMSSVSMRELSLETVVRAEGDSYPDTLDEISLEIESAVSADRTLGGLCHDLKIDQTTIDATGELETPAGQLTIEWQIRYSADVTDPQ